MKLYLSNVESSGLLSLLLEMKIRKIKEIYLNRLG